MSDLIIPILITLLIIGLGGIVLRLDKIFGRDADLVVMVDCQIPSDDLIVHFF